MKPHSSVSGDCYWNPTQLVYSHSNLGVCNTVLCSYLTKNRTKITARTNTLRSPSSLSCSRTLERMHNFLFFK